MARVEAAAAALLAALLEARQEPQPEEPDQPEESEESEPVEEAEEEAGEGAEEEAEDEVEAGWELLGDLFDEPTPPLDGDAAASSRVEGAGDAAASSRVEGAGDAAASSRVEGAGDAAASSGPPGAGGAAASSYRSWTDCLAAPWEYSAQYPWPEETELCVGCPTCGAIGPLSQRPTCQSRGVGYHPLIIWARSDTNLGRLLGVKVRLPWEPIEGYSERHLEWVSSAGRGRAAARAGRRGATWARPTSKAQPKPKAQPRLQPWVRARTPDHDDAPRRKARRLR